MKTMTLTATPGVQEVFETCVFAAPRELVFRVYNDPDLRAKWWGPRELATRVEVMDVRPGGLWRILQHNAQGEEFGFHGVFHSVEAPLQVVQTFEFEGEPGHVILETVKFEDLGEGQTRLFIQSVFQSVAARDAMVASGMERGSAESMERLAELLIH